MSGSAIRVLFRLLALLDGNKIEATQKEIGEPLNVDCSSISRAIGELCGQGLLFKAAKRGVYTINGYFRR